MLTYVSRLLVAKINVSLSRARGETLEELWLPMVVRRGCRPPATDEPATTGYVQKQGGGLAAVRWCGWSGGGCGGTLTWHALEKHRER